MNSFDTPCFLASRDRSRHPLLMKMAEDPPQDSALQANSAPEPAPEAASQPQEPAVKVIPPQLDEKQQEQIKDAPRQVGQVRKDRQSQQSLAPKFVPFVVSSTADQTAVPEYTRREGLAPYNISPTTVGGDSVYTFQNMQFRERPVIVQSPFVRGLPIIDSSPSEQELRIPKWRLGQQAARERYRMENALKNVGDQGETLKTGYDDPRNYFYLSSGEHTLSEMDAGIDAKLQNGENTIEGAAVPAARQDGANQGAGQVNAEGGNKAAPGDAPQPAPGNAPQAAQENNADKGDNKNMDAPKAPSQPPVQPSGEAKQVVPVDVGEWQGTTDYWTKVVENYRKGANDMFNTYMRLRSEYPAYSRRPMQLSVYGTVNMLPLVSMSDYRFMADAYIRYWNRAYGKQVQAAQAAPQVAAQPAPQAETSVATPAPQAGAPATTAGAASWNAAQPGPQPPPLSQPAPQQ